MNWILGIGALALGIWQLVVSKQYFDNMKNQSAPLLFSIIAVIFSMLFAAFLIVYGLIKLFT
ncbi:hypothetical protein COSHB9_14460 [Companilactobacillus alimentarius]|uniref:DUF2970 domain-containing protein n=1 Tax=Companilactobacillus alimentarius DSM 20249 TaxID=1423720 RepID=A0A2K9HJ45_9LACO|nr:hypothetical protein [Companilactobacillus alimentarius]AUI71727.1 hypothetical protein LA20249_05825 [Companilactobacillus alimentarius DSM 20249]KRK76538.1 hypothetical protein FC67_GL000581 [Companilactobacillus alimentarius DSM 20249]MDT6953276.1 hypothetical protein [Companilactobacillus alimentarius]GEO45557.1 hypothetical protein LAL01_17890 [Companilactobacillus alimentarius]